ncbi:MAG: hypothetical protein COW71_09665 [Ignavibacteriales bacterium CG18_big_fil_WC_8_21_14_2_50_31_20]|nr:MAG: hypothetical protein COW71_09665 [Ignavibacteriales bacterium CG18_big_fil_WC_8_21_14_2_50_31_20]
MINKMPIIPFLFFVFVLNCKIIAQFKLNFETKNWQSEYSIQGWTKEDGLPNNKVYDIIESYDGFIWFGTSDGLVRFDGNQFKVFNSSNVPKIKANVVRYLYNDKNGKIWAANGGAGLLSISKDKFELISEENGLSLNHVSTITEDKSGKIYIGTYGGGISILQNGKFNYINSKIGLSSDIIYSILVENNGRIWAGTLNEGVNLIDKNGITIFNHENGLPKSTVKQIFWAPSFGENSKGRILVATNKGVFVFNGKGFEVNEAFLQLKEKIVNHIDEDEYGNLWFSTSGSGIYIYNGKTLAHLSKNNFLPTNDISHVYPTKVGIWICSQTNGIFYIKKNRVKVITKAQGMPNNHIRTIFQSSAGTLWIGTENGIAKYYEHENKIVPIKTNKEKFTVLAWAENERGEIFLGTHQNGLFKIVSDKLVNVVSHKELKAKMIRSLKFDDNGTLWIGTNGAGIALLKNDEILFIDKTNGLSSNFIACISKSGNEELWVGTTGGGVVVLDKNGLVIKSISDKDGLASNIINSISVDENGTKWIGTSVSGISRIKNNSIFNFNEQNGLYRNTIKKLLYDGKKRFWITSNQGIYSIDKNTLNEFADGKTQKLNFSLFGKNDGMLSDEFNAAADNAGCISITGKIYAPSNDGMIVIDPNILNSNVDPPLVYIDDVFINYNKSSKEELGELPPNTESVQINYGGISFVHEKNIKYKYLLQGIDEEWVYVENGRQVLFTHLPYGNYTFKVKSITPDGIESKDYAYLNFTILPYYWQTFWFKILSAFLIIGLISSFIFYTVQRRYKQKLVKLENEAALERERIRISKDIHDELGASLTKISLLSDLAKMHLTDNPNLEDDLNKISEASRNVALTLDEIVWAVNPKNDTLEKTIFYIIQYIEEYISSTEIEFDIHIPDTIPELFIHAELRQNLFMSIKEAVNNVVKHSNANVLSLIVSIEKFQIDITLEDNGKGIDFGNLNQFSNGLENMKKRIENSNGKFEISNKNPNGTRINIKMQI